MTFNRLGNITLPRTSVPIGLIVLISLVLPPAQAQAQSIDWTSSDSAWNELLRWNPEAAEEANRSEIRLLQALTPEQAEDFINGMDAADIILSNAETLAELIEKLSIGCVPWKVLGIPTPGPLTHGSGDLYFSGLGDPVYLTGSHTWNNLQDYQNRPVLSYSGFLDMMASNNHNFMKLWAWEGTRIRDNGALANEVFAPLPWNYTGSPETPTFDLYNGVVTPGSLPAFETFYQNVEFNESYFSRLCTQVNLARVQGIYVSVMLFQGFSVYAKSGYVPWGYHPFNSGRNVNGIDADTNNNGDGEEVHALDFRSPPAGTDEEVAVYFQRAYVRKVVETLQYMDNVLYEISNESISSSKQWQYDVARYIKTDLDDPHPVGMTVYGGNQSYNPDVFGNPYADWVSPGRSPNTCTPLVPLSSNDYAYDPPESTGAKVVVSDNDHIGCILGSTNNNHYRQWIWKNATRGLNTILMDAYGGRIWNLRDTVFNNATNPQNNGRNTARAYLGDARNYVNRLNLASVVPQAEGTTSPSSTGYCLYQHGQQYLVYQPGQDRFEVNLPSGTYSVEWFDPRRRATHSGGTVTGGTWVEFGGLDTSKPRALPFGCVGTSEFKCDSVLLLTK